MRDPLALGYLTGEGFLPADKNVADDFRGRFRVREIIFKSLPSNQSNAWIGYEDMDRESGVEVLECLMPGESFSVTRPSTDRLINLGDYGVLLDDISEKVLVTARID